MEIKIFNTDKDYHDYYQGNQGSGKLAYIQESGDIYFTTSSISGELETYHCSGNISMTTRQDSGEYSFRLRKSKYLETCCTHPNGTYPSGTVIKILVRAKEGYEFTGLIDTNTGMPFSFSEETSITLGSNLDLKETYGKREN